MSGGGAGFGPPDTTSSKLDLLLMVDNSVSMGDKQQLLGQTIPDLIQQLESLQDVHVGIITSSLGGMGGNACLNDTSNGAQKEDMAHLLGALPRGAAVVQGATSANALGFLEWRDAATPDFEQTFSSLLAQAGERGCGYEASLESWYRFLIDPEPYQELVATSCSASGTDSNCRSGSGVDQELLAQRAAFLRPDSLVAVLMLTDENDCSVKASGQAWFAVQIGSDSPLWRAAAVCETDPNSPCCYSCGQAPPAGCAPDAICGDPAHTRETTDYYVDAMGHKAIEDSDNLRCWHQKRRFGVDFLYPTERYGRALTSAQLCVSRNDLDVAECDSGVIAANPLYPLDPITGEGTRNPSMVFLMGVVGVPWQDLVVDPADTEQMRYRTSAEMLAQGTWDLILGDGSNPSDPLMIESVAPRLGATIAPPTAGYLANPVNGHDWQPDPPTDLQYSCIFPLPTPLDCVALEASADPRHCECDGPAATPEAQQSKPLCQTPDGLYGTVQYFGKAYPSIRPLQVMKQVGELNGNAVVTSICPRNVSDDTRQDYGYRPAVAVLAGLLAEHVTP